MGFRTVIVSSHSKLEYSLNYLVYKTIDDIKRINISEINTLIIESTAVSITSALLIELSKRKIKVIFCDEKKMPNSELISYYGDTLTVKRINEQILWSQEIKDAVWKEIIKEKIKNQASVLSIVSKSDAEELFNFSKEVYPGDITNREGHAAKYYFNRLYGADFTRGNNNKKNIYLNYGYSLLLSQFNKAIVSSGYLTQLGIHHKNDNNQYNLACDLMETFRPIIDKKVLTIDEENFKDELINLLSCNVIIANQKHTLVNAINLFCKSIFNALNTNDINVIKHIKINE